MRFTPHKHLHLALLVLLPLWAAWSDWGVVWVALCLAAIGLARQGLLFNSLMQRVAKKDTDLVLEGLPLSHYTEKVRWSLDLTGIDYTEEQDIALLGVFFTGRMVPGLRVPKLNFTICNSPDILRYLYAKNYNDPVKERFFRPTEEALALEKKIDKMGEHIRRFAYSQVMTDPSADQALTRVWGGLNEPMVPKWQVALLQVMMPVLKPFMYKKVNLTPEAGWASLAKSREFFEETDKLLSDGRKFLLGTEKPTYVDVAFAAIAAILAMPEGYPGPTAVNANSRLSREVLPKKEVLDEVDRFNQTPSGKFVFRMYEEFRTTKLN